MHANGFGQSVASNRKCHEILTLRSAGKINAITYCSLTPSSFEISLNYKKIKHYSVNSNSTDNL